MSSDPPEGGLPPVPWRIVDILYGVGLIGVGVVVSVLVLGLVGGGPAADREVGAVALLTAAILEGVMIAAVWLFGVKKYRTRWATAGLVPPAHARWLLLVAVALALNLVFAAAYTIVARTAGADELVPSPLPFDLAGGILLRMFATLTLGVLAPFAEEVFFRGFLLAALVPSLGLYRAMVLSSALFAVSHGVVAVMLPLFITGMLLAWLYVKTRSIWPPVAAHMLQNMLALMVA